MVSGEGRRLAVTLPPYYGNSLPGEIRVYPLVFGVRTRKMGRGMLYWGERNTRLPRCANSRERDRSLRRRPGMGSLSCRVCGKPLPNDRYADRRLYCGQSCRIISHRRNMPAKAVQHCLHCGKAFELKRNECLSTGGRPQKYCSRYCRGAARKGVPSPYNQGGRHTDMYGYVNVLLPANDPLATMRTKNGTVREHRLVMARHLGRPLLKSETVHHIDGDRQNNALENLELWVRPHPDGRRLSDVLKENDRLREENAFLRAEVERLRRREEQQ